MVSCIESIQSTINKIEESLGRYHYSFNQIEIACLVAEEEMKSNINFLITNLPWLSEDLRDYKSSDTLKSEHANNCHQKRNFHYTYA